jgi:TrmH family RNA methyltransferase
MSNFGVTHLRVVNPYEPSFREARSAVGPSIEILAKAEQYQSLADAVSDCSLVVGTTAAQNRELQHSMYRLDAAAEKVRECLVRGNVAIVFGSEKTGLSNDDLSYCHWLLHIPTREQHRSMNLGQAVAVALYELRRDDQQAAQSPNSKELATSCDLDRLTAILLQALEVSGYSTAKTPAATEEKVRRLVRRLSLEADDAEVLTGMLRQIRWKLKRL